MILLPIKRETIVLPFSAEEVEKKLWLSIFPVKPGESMPDKSDELFLFNGWVKNRKFRISRRVRTPENFLPLMKGNIEETSLGSLLFIQYSLFFSSIFFLIFWSVVTFLLTFFFVYFYGIILYGVISFCLGIGNYVVAVANFNIQVKKSKMLLEEILVKS
jgi:hypothetical protein